MFNTEREMQEKFLNILMADLKADEYLVEEFNARFGNVDIVKVAMNGVSNLSELQVSSISDFGCARIIGLLHKNSARSIDFLEDKSGYSKQYIRTILSLLEKSNIITRVSNECYEICPDFEFPKLVFSAYELKLSKWRKAVSQAYYNKKFASYSWVVLPNNLCLSIVNKGEIDIFSEYNVGLIGIESSNSSLKVYIKPNHEAEDDITFKISSIGRFLSHDLVY